MNVAKKMLELQNLSASELFGLFAKIMAEMRQRSIVRSSNNPVADYAEYLVASALDLKLVGPSTTGYDATDSKGQRYEVKARRMTRGPSRQLSAIRGLGKQHFDYLAGVLFNEDFTVYRACLIPFEVIGEVSIHREHVNAHIMHLSDSILKRPDVRDITAQVQAATKSKS